MMRIVMEQGDRERTLRCKNKECESEDLTPDGATRIDAVGAMFTMLTVRCDQGHRSDFRWGSAVVLRLLQP